MAPPAPRAVFSAILVVLSLGSLPSLSSAASAATARIQSRDSAAFSSRPAFPGYNIAVYHRDLVLRGGRSAAAGKAGVDSFYIYGGPGSPDAYGDLGEFPDGWIDGKFQNGALLPAVQPGSAYPSDGWFGVDLTKADPFWQIDSYNGPTGTLALWSGQSAVQQPGWVAGSGYGNNWTDWIDFRTAVAATQQPTTVSWEFVYNHDTEPWYDFFRAQVDSAGTLHDLLALDGTNKDSNGVFTPEFASLGFTLQPGDYVGPGDDEIHLRFRFDSDAGWSDEDGLWPTEGAVQIDDVTVDLGANGGAWFDDFENGFGNWTPVPSDFVGDFAKVFPRIHDIDPCAENVTPQIGFIDDGTPPSNAPGQSTGGSVSAQYGYGVPGGFVVNYTGGLTSGTRSLYNEVRSPAIRYDLPGPEDDAADGVLLLGFNAWVHLPLNNGMFHLWSIRSTTDTPDPGENPTFDLMGWTNWVSNNFVYYGGGVPAHTRSVIDVTSLIPSLGTVKYVQLSLAVVDLADLFAFGGNDATPSPAFDNVSVQKTAARGPLLSARTIDLFQDSFCNGGTPTSLYDGPTGPNDEAEFATRIDRAAAINAAGTQALAGDSISVDISPGVAGTALLAPPVMNYLLFANPAFDHVRVTGIHDGMLGTISGLAGGSPWSVWDGTIPGDSTRTASGQTIDGRFAFDVGFDGRFDRNATLINDSSEPDGFFPGDWFLYYIEATDSAGNVATLPRGPGGGAEPFGFPQQGGSLQITHYWELARGNYDRNFRIRALPTVDEFGGQPRILFVNDALGFGNGAGWATAWQENARTEGTDFDEFGVMGPSSGVDNGIGSAGLHGATADQLAEYECLLYDSGGLSSVLLSDGSNNSSAVDRGDDQGVLTDWHGQSARRFAAYFGDFLYSYLTNFGVSYAHIVLGVELGPGGSDVRPLIGDQSAPRVAPTFLAAGRFNVEFVAFGGCPGLNRFDDIRPLPGSPAQRFHGYLDPSGVSAYPAAASVWFERLDAGYRKIDLSFPFGFQFIQSSSLGGDTGGPSARSQLLGEILWAFDHPGPPDHIDSPVRPIALDQNTPNPFNPSTSIGFYAPKRGRVEMSIYDVRGRRVRALMDEEVEPGEHAVLFDGRDDRGTLLASGAYVYELRGFDQVLAGKMLLAK